MSGSKLDWTSLALVVDEPYHQQTLDLWANPGHYPWMRRALHETYHYWQVLTVPAFTRVVLERYTNFHRIWSAISYKVDSVDLPTPAYDGFVTTDPVYGFSAYDLIEGLTRYWDLHSAGPHTLLQAELGDDAYAEADAEYGPFERLVPGFERPLYTYKAYNYAMLKGDSYSRAYRFLFERMEHMEEKRDGLVGIFFPYMAFAGLQTDQPIVAFAHLAEHASDFFDIALGVVPFNAPTIEDVWKGLMIPFEKWANELLEEFGIEELQPQFVYSDYKLAWQDEPIMYLEDGKMKQLKIHPALEKPFDYNVFGPYLVPPGSPFLQQAMSSEPLEEGWSLAHYYYDDITRLFKLPGVTIHREFLIVNFSPPLTAFQRTIPGEIAMWGPLYVPDDDAEGTLAENLRDQTRRLLALSRAAFATIEEDKNEMEANVCPHFECDWWDMRVCSGVIEYPKDHTTCHAKNLFHSSLMKEYNLDI